MKNIKYFDQFNINEEINMKKAMASAIIGASLLGSPSCSNSLRNDGQCRGGKCTYDYHCSVVEKSGEEDKDFEVDFSVSQDIVNSLKLSEDLIVNICKMACKYADYNVKWKPTYRLPKDGMLYMNGENEIVVSIGGTCENDYGVRGEINSYIKFDTKGQIKLDRHDNPDVVTSGYKNQLKSY